MPWPMKYGALARQVNGVAVLLHDEFTDVDLTSLAVHTMDEGNGWDITGGTWRILDNRLQGGSDIATADAGVADGTLTAMLNPAMNSQIAVVGRFTNASNYWYVRLTQSTGAVQIFEVNAGVHTQRGLTTNTTLTGGEDLDIKVVFDGPSIEAYINNVPQTSYASAMHNQTATRFGFRGYTNNNRYDSFFFGGVAYDSAFPLLANVVGAVGDSITATGQTSTLNTYTTSRGAYYTYTHIVPPTGETIGGGMIPGGIEAKTGDRIQDVLNTHLPNMLARDPRPDFAVVAIGTNNLGGFVTGGETELNARIADMETIYDTFLANGITPIACSVPSFGNPPETFRLAAIDYNTALQPIAAARGLPWVDFFAVTDNGVDGWIEGYTDDDIHPNSVGAKVMGQALRDVIDNYLTVPSPINLITAANESDEDLLWQNGRMVADGNSDGIPDGGQVQSASAWTVQSGGADCAFSLVPEEGMVDGNWWRINKSVYTADTIIQSASGDVSPDVTPGQILAFGFKAKVASVDAATSVRVWCQDISDNNKVLFGVVLTDLQEEVNPFVFYYFTKVPAGTMKLRFYISMRYGRADFYLGQLTCRAV